MDQDEASVSRPAAAPGDRLERLSASARGWHTIQMAVLGFIGICGILRTTSSMRLIQDILSKCKPIMAEMVVANVSIGRR